MKTTILSLLLFVAGSSIAQVDSTVREPLSYEKHSISVLLGYDGWRYHNAEVGIALNSFALDGHHSFETATFVSGEFLFGDHVVFGPKIGAWASGGISAAALGINAIWYTDFDESSLRIRPEFGIGFDGLKIVYGYNIPITNAGMRGVNRSNISVVYLLEVKKRQL